MPFDDPDLTDPNERFGIEVACSIDDVREMAWAFAEEYARMGFGAGAIRELFADARYGGAQLATQVLEAAEISTIAEECARVYAAASTRIIDAPERIPPVAGRLPLIR